MKSLGTRTFGSKRGRLFVVGWSIGRLVDLSINWLVDLPADWCIVAFYEVVIVGCWVLR